MGSSCSSKQSGSGSDTKNLPCRSSSSQQKTAEAAPDLQPETPSIITPEMWARDYADRSIKRAFSSTSSTTHRSRTSSANGSASRHHHEEEQEGALEGMKSGGKPLFSAEGMKSFHRVHRDLASRECFTTPLASPMNGRLRGEQATAVSCARVPMASVVRETFNPFSCTNYEEMLQRARQMASETVNGDTLGK